jgi:hypothetical protein
MCELRIHVSDTIWVTEISGATLGVSQVMSMKHRLIHTCKYCFSSVACSYWCILITFSSPPPWESTPSSSLYRATSHTHHMNKSQNDLIMIIVVFSSCCDQLWGVGQFGFGVAVVMITFSRLSIMNSWPPGYKARHHGGGICERLMHAPFHRHLSICLLWSCYPVML